MPWGSIFVGCIAYWGIVVLLVRALPKTFSDLKPVNSFFAATFGVTLLLSVAIAFFWAFSWVDYWDSQKEAKRDDSGLCLQGEHRHVVQQRAPGGDDDSYIECRRNIERPAPLW